MLPAVSAIRLPALPSRAAAATCPRPGNTFDPAFTGESPPPKAKHQRRRHFLKTMLGGLSISLLLFTAGIIGLIPVLAYKMTPALVFGGIGYLALIATTGTVALRYISPVKLGKSRFINLVMEILVGSMFTVFFMVGGLTALFVYLSTTEYSRPLTTSLLVAAAFTNFLTMAASGWRFFRDTECGY